MKKRLATLLFIFLIVNKMYSQKLKNTFWLYENKKGEPIYYIFYNERKIYTVYTVKDGKVYMNDTPRFYGFYNTCNLPSIDSLKSDGEYFFEVFENDFDKNNWDEENKRFVVQCEYLSIDTLNNEIKLNIQVLDMSPQNGFVSYKKLNKFPQKIIDFIKSKGIILPDENK